MVDIQPWHVASWPHVAWVLPKDPPMIRRLSQRSGQFLCRPAQGQASFGQILWTCVTAQGRAGLAWDWFVVRDNIVAMADPMTIVSNVGFVDAAGRPVPEGQRLLALNTLIACLPWQQQVRPQRTPAEEPVRMAA